MYRRPATPFWRWWMLIGSSALIHGLLAIAALPLLQRNSPPTVSAPVPIEFIELDSVVPPQPAPTQIPEAEKSAAPPAEGSQSAPAPIVEPTTALVAPAELPPPTAASPPPVKTTPLSEPPVATVQPSPSPPPPSPSSSEPDFLTIPLDRPPPDVSQTLPLPDAATPTARVGVEQAHLPVRLTASLEIGQAPTAETGDRAESLAALTPTTSQQDVATLADAACLRAVTPAIVPSLGTRVGVEIAADPAGTVLETVVQTPSQNPDYDALVQCIVQHWGFEPAATPDELGSSQTGLAWVTIESGDAAAE
jgi:outer membrane biosynthesis protein TonB